MTAQFENAAATYRRARARFLDADPLDVPEYEAAQAALAAAKIAVKSSMDAADPGRKPRK